MERKATRSGLLRLEFNKLILLDLQTRDRSIVPRGKNGNKRYFAPDD